MTSPPQPERLNNRHPESPESGSVVAGIGRRLLGVRAAMPGQPVIWSSSLTSTIPMAIHAALTTASCSAQVWTWPVSVMMPPLVSAVTSLSPGTSAERSSASWT